MELGEGAIPLHQPPGAAATPGPGRCGAPELLWVLMVTSVANRGWPGDVAVSDLTAGGLSAASVVRSAKIATIEARDAERIGHLPSNDWSQVAMAMRGSLTQLLAT